MGKEYYELKNELDVYEHELEEMDMNYDTKSWNEMRDISKILINVNGLADKLMSMVKEALLRRVLEMHIMEDSKYIDLLYEIIYKLIRPSLQANVRKVIDKIENEIESCKDKELKDYNPKDYPDSKSWFRDATKRYAMEGIISSIVLNLA